MGRIGAPRPFEDRYGQRLYDHAMGDDRPEIDPIIRGLLVRLPKSGDVWPDAGRKLLLQLLEGSFKLIYKDKEAAD
jgi:hypothetical protein